MVIDRLKSDLASRAKKGINMIYAGLLFWVLMAISQTFLPLDLILWLYVYGTGLVFPLGLLIAKVMHIDFLAKDNPLSTMGGLIGGIQVLFIPLVIIILIHLPALLPVMIGILTGAHFLPYKWLYDSNGYLFLSVSVVSVSALFGFFFPEYAFSYLPMILSIIYIISALKLLREIERIRLT